MKKEAGRILYSPTDLVRFLASPFASWMDRYHLESPGIIQPDEETEERRLIATAGNNFEGEILAGLKTTTEGLVEISKSSDQQAREKTLQAIQSGAPVIYQARLELDDFAGYADFLILDGNRTYQAWDSKLARQPKPYYAIQLCCYSEMLAALFDCKMPNKFGIILGTQERVEFRVEDFIHYYRCIKSAFIQIQQSFDGRIENRPEPRPRADHGRWSSQAEKFFSDTDHIVQVAGISIGQIRKLKNAGVTTMGCLAQASKRTIPKLAPESLEQLVAQARLQCLTRAACAKKADCLPSFELISRLSENGQSVGLASIPPLNPADVFFDMEGYPLTPGGLEYLFGASWANGDKTKINFSDWWAHDRDQEKEAFEKFVDWAYMRRKKNPGMHIYHYASYEVSAMRRLSTRHDTRQDEIDDLLRNEVFVDLYQIVRHGLRIGLDDYSLKKIECLYREKRTTVIATALGSMVEYARWIESGEEADWKKSPILKGIRDYNEDDCKSTAELLLWLRKLAEEHHVSPSPLVRIPKIVPQPILSPEVISRRETCRALRETGDPISVVLADLIDFHRREAKPIWWRMFDRAEATEEELRDDSGCIAGVEAIGSAISEKQSFVQSYRFDPSQECKLVADEDSRVMFKHNLEARLVLSALDVERGTLSLKIGKKGLLTKFGGSFPRRGSLLADEFVSPGEIPDALAAVASKHLSNALHPPLSALLKRIPPAGEIQRQGEESTAAAIRVTTSMKGGCFVCQGPPGAGKTYTASRVIVALLQAGKTVGVTSNSHKAIENLLKECGNAMSVGSGGLRGVKVCGEGAGELFSKNPRLRHVENNPDGLAAFTGGIVGGTAWLFARPEWQGKLDYLFIEEAGQVSLANAVAMSRCAANLILLGDQMQLEQPVQGSHPGDAELSVLQYALKDTNASRPDSPVFHPVIPSSYGLFLSETRRMHPLVSRFISESIYEGRLHSHSACAAQKIVLPQNGGNLIKKEAGIVFSGVEHDGNIQQSSEEIERVMAIYNELMGRQYTDKNGKVSPLALKDFLFIAPYNAQAQTLKRMLPKDARVGSVDKFQGQEAPVCVLSLCSSFGEYGSRGLAFILDRNRINVAISRAKCLAIVVGDPRITSTDVGSFTEMTLVNLFCKIVKAL